jgi:hypothetical protein
MIIPTYWSTPDLPSWKTYDHPISITEEGSLGRTLDNLEEHGYPDTIVLFPAPTDLRIEQKVRDISAGRNLDIRVVTTTDLDRMRATLARLGFPADLLEAVDMTSYGGVRNFGLIYAAIYGFENIIMIDDDECIDEGYRASALRYMTERIGGREVLGKTGCVVDSAGLKIYDGQASDGLADWPKDALFNEAVRKELEATERLTDCTVAFGGNMVLNRKLFLTVPFDPYGTRGEDDDYVLNARYRGYPFFFDRDLLLLHLPPARQRSFWARQRQDILRFRYLREKLCLFGFDPSSVGVFLEYFTRDDLEYKAVSSSIQAALGFVDRDREEFLEFLNNAILAESPSIGEIRMKAKTFLRFMDAWGRVLPKVWDENGSNS